MTTIGALGFVSPWLLLGLIALPILWWLMRATPPAPLRARFPGVAILLGLDQKEQTPQRTPWWLLLLRMAALAAAIVAFSEPLWNPRDRLTGDGPLWIVMDGGWASAPQWRAAQAEAEDLARQAARAGRPVMLRNLSAPLVAERGLESRDAATQAAVIASAAPFAWPPDRATFLDEVKGHAGAAETVWFADGLDPDGAGAALGSVLVRHGPLRVALPDGAPLTIRPGATGAEGFAAEVARSAAGTAQATRVVAYEAGALGRGRALGAAEARFAPEDSTAEAVIALPHELRNRVGLVALSGAAHAGGAAFVDARWRRKRVGLVAAERTNEGGDLLSGAHYVREALASVAELREGALADLLKTDGLDALILIDIAQFAPGEAEALGAWVEAGGALIRFAGPNMAGREGGDPDPLSPVRLRPGGRELGGAMSWGAPQTLAPFTPESPFSGLIPPADAAVSRQVLAEPDAELPARTWARLTGGAPLVTGAARGAGRIVLFHTAADPRWSQLPLSGLFIEMLRRVVALGASDGGAEMTEAARAALWRPVLTVNAFGEIAPAPKDAQAAAGSRIAAGVAPGLAPGIYESLEGGGRRALNLSDDANLLAPLALPKGAVVSKLGTRAETPLAPWLLAAALACLLIDGLATLRLMGRLGRGAAAALAVALALHAPHAEAAGQAAPALDKSARAALDGALGYVRTGDAAADEAAQAGLFGLTVILTQRTAIEPAAPVAVDLETDDLAVFPLLYWPISTTQPAPTPEAIGRLNAYLRGGGLIVFDTRDDDLAYDGSATQGALALRRLTRGLELPPLTPVTPGHLLGRTFYLLDDFPGRYIGGPVWVEAASDQGGGRFVNDGVSPVIVGGRDWAAAWAMSERGDPLFPIDPARREAAMRFGVNLVMYALTGAYKSDQVHLPMLLERMR